MNGGWAVVAVGVGLLAWALYADLAHDSEDRLARWLVPTTLRWGRGCGVAAFVISLVFLATYGAAAWVGAVLAEALGDPRWSLLVLGPAMLAYTPLVFAMAPVEPQGYRYWRESLRKAGAQAGADRWIAWLGGVPAFVGLLALVMTPFLIFLI
ncbi:hypothetical protein ACOCJ7_00375 [Knoellia sp. CPCC 206453]|uniref:hypothetical protein n=1 Tax=Knoellia pratensis TaxID=3404796 RepID=UPI00361F4B7F